MRYLVVVGDDFGLCPGVNRGSLLAIYTRCNSID